MDIPAGLQQWQWQATELNLLNQNIAYQLIDPVEPDWQQLQRWYPDCNDNKHINFWVCVINGRTWSFFQFDDARWVLMPVVTPTAGSQSPLPLGLDMLSFAKSNGYAVYIYFSNKPLHLLQRQLKFRLAQRIDHIQSVEGKDNVWVLKGDDGRLIFTHHRGWTFVTLVQ